MDVPLTIAAALAATLCFALYVEASSSMGNIWLRRNHENALVFAPLNLVRLMCEPLQVWTAVGRSFWVHPGLWLINWPLWLVLVTALVCGFGRG